MWKVGHRGAMGHVAENTLASFAKAIELGVDALECDVHVCKPSVHARSGLRSSAHTGGEPVVIHDLTVDRTTNGKGRVRDLTLEQLKELDAGGGEKIPTLRELMDFVKGRMPLFIELKSPDSVAPVANLVNEYVAAGVWDYEDLLVISFNHPLLIEVKRLNPNIVTGATIEGIPADYAETIVATGAGWVNPCIDFLNEPFVTDARAKGLKIFTWTCNSEQAISRAKRLGADAIASDYPERL